MYRERIIQAIIERYMLMNMNDDNGIKPLYRSGQEMLTDKKEKTMKRGGQEWTNHKVMMKEQLGKSIIVDTIRRPNPTPPSTCHKVRCKPCLLSKKDMLCYKANIGYRVVCNRSLL